MSRFAKTSGLLIGLSASLSFADNRVLVIKEPLFRGVIFPEVVPKDGLGIAATGVGDFNGDGVDDLAIGATPVLFSAGFSPSGLYLVFGRPEFPATFDLATDPNTVKLFTDTLTFGADIVAAGDLDDDGLADVYVSQPRRTISAPAVPRLYLVYGSRDLPREVPVEEIAASVRGAILSGAILSGAFFSSITSVGDINGDGTLDLAFGESSSIGPLDERGSLRILFGSALEGEHELDALIAGGLGVKILGSPSSDQGNQRRGYASTVSPAGDVNGDGLPDIVLADPEYRNAQSVIVGRVQLIYGFRPWPPLLRAEELGSLGVTITTEGKLFPGIEDVFGGADLDGDGFAEFGFSLHNDEPEPFGIATLYVVRGGPGLPGSFLVSAIGQDIPGFAITPEDRLRGQGFAGSVLFVPDEDGDGRPEIFAGSRVRGNPSLVLRGAYPLMSAAIEQPLHAFEAPGAQGTGSHVGQVVDSAGDVNADGFPDYVIGSPNVFVRSGDSRQSIAFLLFGGFETESLSIREVAPAQAPVGQSLAVTISGTGFSAGARVFFGEVEVEDVAIDDPHTLRVMNPTSTSSRTVDITIVHPDSRRVVLAGGFRFNEVREAPIDTLDAVVFRLLPGSSTITPEVLGDIDGDNREDYVLRQDYRPKNKSYLVYGGTSWSGVVEEPALAAKSVRFKGPSDHAPYLFGLRDLDGDGDHEYAVQAPYREPGEFAILFDALLPGLDFEFGSWSDPALFSSTRTFGSGVFNAGDFDGDGEDDLLVSLQGGDEEIVIIRGPFIRGERVDVDSDPKSIRIHDPRGGPNIFGDGFGPIGDFNGDGRADIGVHSWRPDSAILVLLGHEVDFPLLDAADLEASGKAFRFPALLTSLSTSLEDVVLSRAGDLNGDGFADLLVKCWTSPVDDNQGFVGFLLGRSEMEPGTSWTSEVTGRGGFLLHGTEPMGHFGFDAVTAGDLDGSGSPDLLVGEWRFTELRAGPQRGVAYIIHDMADLRGESPINEVSRGVTAITGLSPADHFGQTVRILGDQDGDSFPELLVEASYLTIGGGDTIGRTYLIKGSSLFGEQVFIRGDSNLDGLLNITDPIGVLGGLFQGGPPILCEDSADATDDGRLDISDPIRVLNFLFSGGTTPPAPYPDPGADPTADALTCKQGRRG